MFSVANYAASDQTFRRITVRDKGYDGHSDICAL